MSAMEKWEEFLANNCDGTGPHAMLAGNPPVAEVRRMQTSGGAGTILCYACHRREIAWRVERNKVVAHPFDLPSWSNLPVYASEVCS